MSDKHARILAQPSNRAKAKDTQEKKAVFKSALANPYLIQWPSVPLNLQNNILNHLVQALAGFSDYRIARSCLVRKRKRASQAADSAKRKKPKNDSPLPSEVGNDGKSANLTKANNIVLEEQSLERSSDFPGPQPPTLMRHIVHGINEVTKRLETQARASRRPILIAHSEPTLLPPLANIFVCRTDVNPCLLVDHLPHLVAACNSNNPKDYVKLIPLPKGSEAALAKVLGVRRVTVMAIDRETAEDQQLKSLLDQVPILSATWLSGTITTSSFVESHVKHIRTTAPKDMKAAKESRTRERNEAKRRKKVAKTS